MYEAIFVTLFGTRRVRRPRSLGALLFLTLAAYSFMDGRVNAASESDSPAVADELVKSANDYFNDALPAMRFRHEIKNTDPIFIKIDGMLARALEIYEKSYPPDDPHIALVLWRLARVRAEEPSHKGDAAQLYAKAISIYEKRDGPNAPIIADVLADSESMYEGPADPRKFDELESVLKRVIAIRESAYGPDDRRVAEALIRLSAFYTSYRIRFDLAEPVQKRTLAICEKVYSANSGQVREAIIGLAMTYQAQGRYDDAIALYKRFIAIEVPASSEAVFGASYTATGLRFLAATYISLGRFAEAKDAFVQAQGLYERTFGPEDGDVGIVLMGIADVDRQMGDYAEAERLLKRASAINEKDELNDKDDLDLAYVRLYVDEMRYADAEPPLKNVAGKVGKYLDPLDPEVAVLRDLRSQIYAGENRLTEAMTESRAALKVLQVRAANASGGHGAILGERRSLRDLYEHNVDLSEKLAVREPTRRAALTGDAFEVAQFAEAKSTEQAVSQMAARFASNDDALAKIIRSRQDAQDEWVQLDAALARYAAAPPDGRDTAAEQAARDREKELDRLIGTFDARLAGDFPKYAEIANPRPVPLAAAQKLLNSDEVLMTYFVGEKSSFLWVVRPHAASLLRLNIGRHELESKVAQLRSGLDPSLSKIKTSGDVPPFDTAAAFALYQQVFAPAEPLLSGSSTIFAVLDGALQSLPLGVLVTQKPGKPPTEFSDYKTVPWLARRHAFTILPAASSLRALRVFAQAKHAVSPFAGFGDPAFEGGAGDVRAARIFRGADVDIAELRRLPRLPDTANEIRAQALALHAPQDSIHLGSDASVTTVKHAQLVNVRVITFATHGLIAGDLPALSEPALALSPPSNPSPEDNGLLMASDIARLNLNADWVVLSACNTAAPDGSEGADGLSGLAKAFFYAGSRSMMVSHWPVDSVSTVKLTTGAFAALEKDRSIGRAEALRLSMMAVIDQAGFAPSTDYEAHPMFWAPFVVVGEGGNGR